MTCCGLGDRQRFSVFCTLCSVLREHLSSGGKRSVLEADHSSPPAVGFSSAWSCTPLPTRLNGVVFLYGRDKSRPVCTTDANFRVTGCEYVWRVCWSGCIWVSEFCNIYTDSLRAVFLCDFHFIILNAFRRYWFAIIRENKLGVLTHPRLNASLWRHLVMVALTLLFTSGTSPFSLVTGLLLVL